MDNYTELIERLYKHHRDYGEGRTQNVFGVVSDCRDAADALTALTEDVERLTAQIKVRDACISDYKSIIKHIKGKNAQLCAELDALRQDRDALKRERDSLKVYFLDVSSQPDCNTCGGDCQYRPRIGEPIRINCPLWRGPQKEE